MHAPDPIFDAASVILRRGDHVLMGQRGARAAFMPAKYVFPGGRLDSADLPAPDVGILQESCRAALAAQPRADAAPSPDALLAAALRELAEETGLRLARPRPGALRFVFRAITPAGRPRRFDARFFLAKADDFSGDMERFSAASDELSHLHWVHLPAAQALDLPFITSVILAEVAAGSPCAGGVPFFDNRGARSAFSRL